MPNELQILQVHFGRNHSTKKYPGNSNNRKELEQHLTQCDIFVCDNIGCRNFFLTESAIRKQNQKEHKKNAPEHYCRFYWEYNAKDKSEIEFGLMTRIFKYDTLHTMSKRTT